MADNLTIFGTTYSNVAGFKATDTDSNTKTFIRPTGSETKTVNGTYDVTNLAQLVVNVSGGGNYPWFGQNTTYVGRIIDKTFNLKNDTTFDSWTASTTAGTIKAASSTADGSQAIDYNNMWWFVYRAFVEVAFLPGATLQTTVKRFANYYIYQIYPCPSNNGNLVAGTNNTTNNASTDRYGIRYYGNTANTLAYFQGRYGPMYTSNPSQTASGTTYSWKIPSIQARCSTSYFTTARKTEVDSANTNMVVTMDVYKTPIPNGYASWMVENLRTDMTSGL